MSSEENANKTWIDEVDFKKISCSHLCGFEPCFTVRELVDEGKLAKIPKKMGVYLILAPRKGDMPNITDTLKKAFGENGKELKKKSDLEPRWNKETQVIYIGKAGVLNGKGTSNLYTRLRAYLKWYQKEKNSHHGGRDIWQLHNPGDLLVTWRVTEGADPRECERKLLERFDEMFGEKEQKKANRKKQKKRLPFANHQS